MQIFIFIFIFKSSSNVWGFWSKGGKRFYGGFWSFLLFLILFFKIPLLCKLFPPLALMFLHWLFNFLREKRLIFNNALCSYCPRNIDLIQYREQSSLFPPTCHDFTHMFALKCLLLPFFITDFLLTEILSTPFTWNEEWEAGFGSVTTGRMGHGGMLGPPSLILW